MSDNRIQAFGATVGDGPRAEGLEAHLTNFEKDRWTLRIGEKVIADIEFEPITAHLITAEYRTNFVIQLADPFLAQSIVDIPQGLTVVGQRRINDIITHLVVNVPSPSMPGTKSQSWVKLQKTDGTAFTIVGIPSHGSIYTTAQQPIPVAGWHVNNTWESKRIPAEVFLTGAGPILSKKGRIHSFVHWTDKALNYMEDPGYQLALIDFEAVPNGLLTAEFPDDIHLVGTLQVNNFPLMVFAIRNDQKNTTITFPTPIPTQEVCFEGFPGQLICRQKKAVTS